MADKIWCGKGKQNQYGIRIRICLDDIPQEHTSEFKGKRYATLNVGTLREIDQKGNTHSVSVDTWKPQAQAPQPQNNTNEDLPF